MYVLPKLFICGFQFVYSFSFCCSISLFFLVSLFLLLDFLIMVFSICLSVVLNWFVCGFQFIFVFVIIDCFACLLHSICFFLCACVLVEFLWLWSSVSVYVCLWY